MIEKELTSQAGIQILGRIRVSSMLLDLLEEVVLTVSDNGLTLESLQ